MRPDRLVFVTATGTEVGKTWVAAALARSLVARGVSVAVRKPAQSFDPTSPEPLDSAVLAAAVGCAETEVCPAHRWYPTPLAPPMAAQTLGRETFTIAALATETRVGWGVERVRVGLVEGAGGLRSPLADDGDNLAFASAIEPDVVVLVADAGLGTINQVRLNLAALSAWPVVVFLNRFSVDDRVHMLNRDWLTGRDGLTVVTDVEALVGIIGI